jgi:hypothetical protein
MIGNLEHSLDQLGQPLMNDTTERGPSPPPPKERALDGFFKLFTKSDLLYQCIEGIHSYDSDFPGSWPFCIQ